MRRLLLFPMLVCLSLTLLHADEKSQIEQIRKWYATIEADEALKKTSYKTDGEDDPYPVTLTRYANNAAELRKMNLQVSGAHGFTSTTYYFIGGELVFVYEASESWQFGGGKKSDGQAKTIDTGLQLRYYFYDEKCIKVLRKTAQTKKADELRALMEKAKNEVVNDQEAASKVLKDAMALSDITSRKALEAYFARP